MPVLTIAKSHIGNFAQGQRGATYTVTVSNSSNAGPTSGTVTVTEAVPAGMTLVSMNGGATWTCAVLPVCTTTNVLNPGSSYAAITVTVNVGTSAPSPLSNQVSVSYGASGSAAVSDSTTIDPFSPCDINQDRSIDMNDIRAIMLQVLGGPPPYNDLNHDGVVNMLDVQKVVNAIAGPGCIVP